MITDQDRRLGRWMDWDNDYHTFSDTNISYIWGFLKAVHERGWLYKGHRSTEWCPRCGTSISQHELFAGEYKELEHPSLYVRFPLKEREDEALVVWTTTPWTLPANVAAAVKPDAEYGLPTTASGARRTSRRGLRPRGRAARSSSGSSTTGPFDDLPAQDGRRPPRDPVGRGLARRGDRDRPHRARAPARRTSSSRGSTACRCSSRSTSRGGCCPGTGRLRGALDRRGGRRRSSRTSARRGLLVDAGRITHRYPTCWRCGTPLVFRVVDDWFIACDEIRQPMLDANATVEWTPDFYSKRMDDWLRNMGDWNISRKRYFGLPLPIYPCDCGELNVIGSRAELEERATAGLDQLQELHRPWVDEVTIALRVLRRRTCGAIPEVGDAWLDAGIVPFSTLGWQNPEWIPARVRDGRRPGLSGADLPDHAYWEQWFPADWISEMREQIRLWFYSISFMSMTLDRAARRTGSVLTYEKLLDETGAEMHRSWGNAIEPNEALERMGADVMRWQFCEQNPGQNLKFGYGPADEVKRRLLTLWNSVKFFVDYANIEGFGRRRMRGRRARARSTAGSLARTEQLVAEATDAYERYWTPDVIASFESFVDDLSNWYIRRSRRRFWNGDAAALADALVRARPVARRDRAGDAVPRRAPLAGARAPDGRARVGLPRRAGRSAGERDEQLLAEVAETRRVVELGRQARAASGLKLRQPLRRLVVEGAPLASGTSTRSATSSA